MMLPRREFLYLVAGESQENRTESNSIYSSLAHPEPRPTRPPD